MKLNLRFSFFCVFFVGIGKLLDFILSQISSYKKSNRLLMAKVPLTADLIVVKRKFSY